jgi:hypothetical protein
MRPDRHALRALCRFFLWTLLLSAIVGCPPPPERTPPVQRPLPPLPLAEAVNLINRQNENLQATIQARAGHARGFFHDRQGRKRSYDLDAAVLIHPPRGLRMDLSMLGKSQLVFGSNEDRYWVIHPSAKVLSHGRHDRLVPPKIGDLPVRPDLLVEAIGFNTLSTDTAGAYGPVARVDEPDYQQLLFLEYNDAGQAYIAREYWIALRPPRAIERIVFRDANGKIMMDSKLSEYRRIEGGPPMPHRIEISWPANRSEMLFTTSTWRMLPDVGLNAPSFTFPLDRGEEFERIIDLDEESGDVPFSFPEIDTGAGAAE